ncbi:unnamed protein product [Nesidiocoris tenuis]|nr:unnamed protein product [Nesidiocoris tenuis]
MAKTPDPVYSFRGEMKDILCILLTERSIESGDLKLLLGTVQGIVHQWDLKMKREEKKIRVGEMACVSLVETSSGFATLEKGESLKIWTTSWDLLKKIDIDYCGFCNLAYSSGKLFYPKNDGKIGIIDTSDDFSEKSQLFYKYNKKHGEVMYIKMLAGSKNIIACYESGLIAVWDCESGMVVCETEISDTPMCADYCESTSALVIGTVGNSLAKFTLKSDTLELECRREITNPGVSSVSLRDDGKLCAATCWDGNVRYFSTKSMKLLAVLDNKSTPNCAIFNKIERPHCAKGLVLVGGNDGRVWDLKNLAEDVRSVAEQTLNQSAFVYDSQSGNYYNHEQQCYYIPDHKLYYYVANKAYYTYDEETNAMKFYSSTEPQYQDSSGSSTTQENVDADKNSTPPSSSAAEVSSMETASKPLRAFDDEIEEGEIVDEDDEEGEIKSNPASPQMVICASPTRNDLNVEPDGHCAPCIRITVRECSSARLEVGQLFIITRTGGSLGREGDHDIVVPDDSVSKKHLTFHYAYREGVDVYEIVDGCSRNNTFLNGLQMRKGQPYLLEHGAVLKVGGTTLLCHIHAGRDTCAECEPSCLGFMTPLSPQQAQPQGSLRQRHAQEVQQIKKKFGLSGPQSGPRLPKGYEDKSKLRRETVGSSHDSEKTESTSTDAPLRSDNKGYGMLAKMGWKEGQGVGKSSDGAKEPVNVTVKLSKRGLGCPEDDYVPPSKPKSKSKTLQITKQRFEA